MKTVILAGGFGTRLSEETILKPKPMVEIKRYSNTHTYNEILYEVQF